MSAPIVLLHGFTQTGASWDGVRAALPAGRTVLTPDLRGHGRLAGARPVTLAAVLDDLDDLVDGAVLGGYSMGGRIALAYAVARPQRVRRLVLVAASPGLADRDERRVRRDADEALARRIEEHGIAAFAAEWENLPLFAGQPLEVAAAARQQRLRQDPAGLAAALRGLGTGVLEPLWHGLAGLGVPTTLMAGELDAKFGAIAEAMVTRLPDARLVIVPGAGHAVHLEAPASVAAALLAYRGTGSEHR